MAGNAESFDDVSEFMRGLNNIVWCPKGMGRVVERKRDGNFRVELHRRARRRSSSTRRPIWASSSRTSN